MSELTALRIGDDPARWRALGFAVDAQGRCGLGGVTLQFDPAATPGIRGWSLPAIDGLPHVDVEPIADGEHPNRVVGIDHLVVLTPDFDRTAAAFAVADLAFRRVRETGDEVRQGFRRCGPAIVEVVEVPQLDPGPAKFWGLVPVVEDLAALQADLGSELIGDPKRAVQRDRRIATVRRAAGLACAVAFMTPDP